MEEEAFLVGERLYLRPLRRDDAHGPYPRWLNDPEVCRFNSHHVRPYLPEHAIEYIETARTSRSDLILAIVELAAGKHVGNVALHGVGSVNRCAEFAILLGDRSAWGAGVGAEAARLIVRHGFEALGLRRIECGTTDDNEAMLKLAAKLGMREEGRRRQAVWKRGRFVDVVEFGVLSEEFHALERS